MAKKLMKLTCIMLIISFLAPAALAQSPGPPPGQQAELAPHVPGEVLVKFQPWVNSAQAEQHLAALNLQVKRQIPALGVKLVKLPPGLSVEEALSRFSNRHGIQYVEPNYIYQITADPPQEVPDQWSLTRIQAPQAWETFTPEQKQPILLATVDTGIDRYHSDLSANIWSNQDELPGNGIDKLPLFS